MSTAQVFYVLAATILIPCVVGLIKYRGLTLPFRLFTVLLLMGCLTETVMISLAARATNNLFALHFYSVAEITLLSLFYYTFIHHVLVRRGIIFIMVCLVIFAIIYATSGTNIAEFNSIPRALECVYFTLLSCWLFFEMSDYQRPVTNSDYYLNGALMFYFSSCFVIFAFNKYMAANPSVLWAMVKTHAIVNAFCNLVYGLALWIAPKHSYQHS